MTSRVWDIVAFSWDWIGERLGEKFSTIPSQKCAYTSIKTLEGSKSYTHTHTLPREIQGERKLGQVQSVVSILW